ncbi:acetate--CoA ligase family protein [Deferrisoma sp.]
MNRGLRALLSPRSVAVVGATPDPGKLGYSVCENLLQGGFPGEVYPVNPRHREIMGRRAYRSLEDIGRPVDLVLSAVGARATIDLVERCGRAGVRAVVAFAAGFREVGGTGQRPEEELGAAADRAGVCLLGPNTPGLIHAGLSLNATFFPFRVEPGPVAVITQSGGVGGAIYRKLLEEGTGIAYWIGVGNRTRTDFADLVPAVSENPAVRVVALYLEGTERGRDLIAALRAASCRKPVVVLKGGRGEGADSLTLGHTGSLAGAGPVVQGVLRQARAIQVGTATELACACKALALCPAPPGGRVGILTPSGGGSIVIHDILAEWGTPLADLSDNTRQRLRDSIGNVSAVILKNPLDLTTSGFDAGLYGRVARRMAEAPEVDILLAVFPIHKDFPPPDEHLVEIRRNTGKPVVVYWIAIDRLAQEEDTRRRALEAQGVPVFLLPEEAAWAVRSLSLRGGWRTGRVSRRDTRLSARPPVNLLGETGE